MAAVVAGAVAWGGQQQTIVAMQNDLSKHETVGGHERTRERVSQNEAKLAGVGVGIGGLNARLDRIEARLDLLQQAITRAQPGGFTR